MTAKVPTTRRDAVIARDLGKCVIAGPGCMGDATLADHRANRGMGGSKVLNDMVCLIAACVICNGLKEDADGPYRARLVARGVRVEKDSTNKKTLERCQRVYVLYADGWHQLVGVERNPVNEHTAVEYMVLTGAIREGVMR